MKASFYKIILVIMVIAALSFGKYAQAIASKYTVTDLGTLGGDYSYSEAINDAGQVFGYSRFTNGGPLQAFIWDSAYGMQYYEGNPRTARRTNALGQEVGTSTNPEGYLQAQINGSWLSMPSGYQSSVGEGINNFGQAVGHASMDTPPHAHHAFLWYSTDEMIELGTLGGDQRRAYGINDDGGVVGESSIPSSSYPHGFIWTITHGMQDLNDLVLPGHSFEFIGAAYDINNAGQIAAQGRIDGTWHAILLAAAPVIEVNLDIKPQSCPNPINTESRGVLPVAILGTHNFDVTRIDRGSIRLSGIAPLRSNLEDVAAPFEPLVGKEDAYDCNDYGPDGYIDLTLKFHMQQVVAALGAAEDGDVLVLTLTGELQEEFGRTQIEGEDVVVILKKGKR